jgi:hypothetical protein
MVLFLYQHAMLALDSTDQPVQTYRLKVDLIQWIGAYAALGRSQLMARLAESEVIVADNPAVEAFHADAYAYAYGNQPVATLGPNPGIHPSGTARELLVAFVWNIHKAGRSKTRDDGLLTTSTIRRAPRSPLLPVLG